MFAREKVDMAKPSALMFLTFAALLCCSGCVTDTVSLGYKPASAVNPAGTVSPAHVAVGDFTDNRHEPVRWIGAIRGGYGNPLKKLETDKPVSEIVKDAFRQSLLARGLFAEDGRFIVSGWIDKLDGDQYVRKEATVQLHVSVTDRATHREVFSRPASGNQIEGSLATIKTGVFGSVEELRALIERVLSVTVDSVIDSSAFREAFREGSPQQLPGSLRDSIHVGMPLIDLTAVAPKPLAAIDKLNAAGAVTGKTFTYDNGGGQVLLVTVENGVVTAIELK